MKESGKYLNFIRENLLIILIPTLIFPLTGYFYQSLKPAKQQVSSLWQVEYNISEVSSKINLADEAVGNLRSNNLQESLNTDPSVRLNIFKPSPISIKIEVLAETKESAEKLLIKFEDYLRENYQVKQIGGREYLKIAPDTLKGIILGLVLGGSIGVIVSLSRTYFRKY